MVAELRRALRIMMWLLVVSLVLRKAFFFKCNKTMQHYDVFLLTNKADV